MSRDDFTIQRRQANRPVDRALWLAEDLTVNVPKVDVGAGSFGHTVAGPIDLTQATRAILKFEVSAMTSNFGSAHTLTAADPSTYPSNIFGLHIVGSEARPGGVSRLLCSKFLDAGLTITGIPVQQEAVGGYEVPFSTVAPAVRLDPTIIADQAGSITEYDVAYVPDETIGTVILNRITLIGQLVSGVGNADSVDITLSARIVVDTD